MAKTSLRSRTTRLRVEGLEDRTVPASDFQILSLTADNAAIVDHTAVTGDDVGGIAASASQVFVTGTDTGRFNLGNLSNGTSLNTSYHGLTSDLQSKKTYTLGSGVGVPISSNGGLVTHLLEIDGSTGALTGTSIAVSNPFFADFQTGIFAGYGRVVVHPQNGSFWEIALPSGNVSFLGSAPTPQHNFSNSWAFWGVAEHFGGQDYVTYVQDFQTIARQRTSDGQVTTFPSFANLGDMASFTVSPANNRWYFHNEGFSQFSFNFGDEEILGYADATFMLPSIQVTNTNDNGNGSLRQAIIQANGNPGPDIITFAGDVNGSIVLTTGNLSVSESLEIQGPGSNIVTVVGNTGNQLLVPTVGGVNVSVSGLKLRNLDGQTFSSKLTTKGDVVIDGGTQHLVFSNALNVETGTLSLIDAGRIELGPQTTVDGVLFDEEGFDIGGNKALAGTGTVASNVFIGSGGTLSGSLSINKNVVVQSGGNIAPGPSAAQIDIAGDLEVQSGGKLTIEINGPGNGLFDSLFVGGTVNLGTGNNFVLSLGYAPLGGQNVVIIDNESTDTVQGFLNDVRNRSGVKIGNTLFQVRLDGGTGNDVELVVNQAPEIVDTVTTTLTPILEDTPTASNPGTSIEDLLGTGGFYSDSQGLFRSGIAVTDLDSTKGLWQYTRDGGTNWTTFGSVDDTSATLLESNKTINRLRFLPNVDFFGTATIQYRAWDAADGKADGATGIDATTAGDNNSFSLLTETTSIHVLAANDAPDALNDTATINEDGGAQTIDVLDNDTFTPDVGETLTIVAVTQGQHGTVAITGAGTLVTYTPDADYAGPDTFLYTISDGNGGSDIAAVTVNVTNDAGDRLEVITSTGLTTFTESLPVLPVVVDAGVQVGTGLEGVLSAATVKFASGYVKNKDKLQFTTMGAIRGTFNVATGTLSLKGIASPADYQAALRTVKYTNASPAPVDGVRKITFQVQDVAGTGEVAAKLLKVVGVNSKATLTLTTPSPTYTNRGKPLAIASALRIKDIDNTRLVSAKVSFTGGFQAGDVLSVITKPGITVVFTPGTGELVLTGNATIATYMAVLKSLKFTAPTGTTSGLRTLAISVNDGLIDSDPLTRTVNVV